MNSTLSIAHTVRSSSTLMASSLHSLFFSSCDPAVTTTPTSTYSCPTARCPHCLCQASRWMYLKEDVGSDSMPWISMHQCEPTVHAYLAQGREARGSPVPVLYSIWVSMRTSENFEAVWHIDRVPDAMTLVDVKTSLNKLRPTIKLHRTAQHNQTQTKPTHRIALSFAKLLLLLDLERLPITAFEFLQQARATENGVLLMHRLFFSAIVFKRRL